MEAVAAAPAADAAVRELAALWHNRIDGGYFERQLPNEARLILANRLNLLHVAFSQQVGDFMLGAVAEMLKPFFRHAEPRAYLYVFRQTVPAPAWAAAGAIKRARAGELASPDFAPTPGRLRAAAWDMARPFWVERRRLAQILAAKPPRPEESVEHRRKVAARILAEWQKTVSEQRLLQVSSTGLSRQPADACVSCNLLDLPDF